MGKSIIKKENFLNRAGDQIVFKISFSKKDGSLTAWVQSIPRGRFSEIVKKSIRAYLKNDFAYKLPRFPKVKAIKPTIAKSFSIGKEDYDIYSYIYSIDSGLRCSEIKKILTHFINGEALMPPKRPVKQSKKTKIASTSDNIVNRSPDNSSKVPARSVSVGLNLLARLQPYNKHNKNINNI